MTLRAPMTAGLLIAGLCVAVSPANDKAASTEPTHQQTAEVSIRGTDGRTGLQTLCLDSEGRVLALVAPPRSYGAPIKNGFGEVHVLAADGKPVGVWKVGFHANSIGVAPNGQVFVAGDGRIARFAKDGTALGEVELPHLAELVKDSGDLRKKAEAQVKAQEDAFARASTQLKEQLKKLEDKKAEDRTPREEKLIEQYKTILKSYETGPNKRTVEQVMADTLGRLRTINAVAASNKDVFIACGDAQGFGYAIWRFSPDLKDAKQVLNGIGGCCGQMDIQVHNGDLLVAENTKHRFARYDREGKALGAWGKRGADGQGDGFGGCCNPMNLRCCGGDIYTAESEGHVKRFAANGDFLGVVGSAKIAGGCKNVAIGVSPDGSTIFFCDQPGSRVLILSKKK